MGINSPELTAVDEMKIVGDQNDVDFNLLFDPGEIDISPVSIEPLEKIDNESNVGGMSEEKLKEKMKLQMAAAGFDFNNLLGSISTPIDIDVTESTLIEDFGEELEEKEEEKHSDDEVTDIISIEPFKLNFEGLDIGSTKKEELAMQVELVPSAFEFNFINPIIEENKKREKSSETIEIKNPDDNSSEDILSDIKGNTKETGVGLELSENFLLSILNPRMEKEQMTSSGNILSIELNTDNTIQDDYLADMLNSDIDILQGRQNIITTEESITARSMLNEYEKVIKQRKHYSGIALDDVELNTIDINRDLFAHLDDIDPEELGELFDAPPEIVEYNQESSSSSSSEDSEGVTWYQLVPTTSLIEGTYNFDEKCKQSMLDFNTFLMKIFVEKDVNEIIRNKQDLALVLVLCNNILQKRKIMKLTKVHKTLVKALIVSLENVLKNNSNTYYSFASNMGLKWDKGKIKCYAMLPLEDKQLALDKASSNPLVNYAYSVSNCDTSVYWLTMPLLQEDLDDFFSKGFQVDNFQKNTQFTSLLNSLIPRLQKVEFNLIGKYSF